MIFSGLIFESEKSTANQGRQFGEVITLTNVSNRLCVSKFSPEIWSVKAGLNVCVERLFIKRSKLVRLIARER